MVNRLAFLVLFLVLSAAAVARGSAPCDTVMVFKKAVAESTVIKKEALKKRGAKKGATKKKQQPKSAVKKAPVKPARQKVDSVKFTATKYYLGDRVLMRGDSGADVKKLAEIMVKNLYLDEKDVPYTTSGEVLYDKELLRSVKLFQKVSGLYDDGIVGETTIKELRKIHRWRRMKSNR